MVAVVLFMETAARVGLGAVVAGVAVIIGLDLAYLGEINPFRRTISEHGLGDQGWIFGLGVGTLALGSAAIGLSLAKRRIAGWFGTVALLAWSVGLLITASFPKHDWAVGPSLSGSIHRVGSFVAFLSLPIAALVIARPWRHRHGVSWLAFLLGLGSVLWVAGIGAVIMLATRNGLAWWQVMPLGLVERGMAATEVAAVIALGAWACLRGPTRSTTAAPASG
ncbi:DUF998 domain-containing protein [Nonomuraea sp. NPDC050790]|uniref:DUF998 domain-containing protein n=1 Tax=Nonomuraea sp. NPDC050790 TaxID=3364371 RepID=UPI0037AADB6E